MEIMNITSNNLWELPISVTASGVITKTLNTAGTFLDRNIGIKVSTTASTVTETITQISNNTVTSRGEVSWGNGWIAEGGISAATFSNSATSGITYKDISDTTQAPILVSNGYLYINKGYTDNLKISLAKLVPNDATITITNSIESAQILSGYAAYDNNGILLSGNIPTKTAETYYTSTSDRTIQNNQYLSGIQTIKAVKTANISAGNIKYNVIVKVGDDGSAGRIKNVTGTFTGASTVSSGQTAATANKILTGYSAWVNGAEVKGSIANGAGITFDGKTAKVAAGYYATETTANMSLAEITFKGGALTTAFVNADNKVITTAAADDYNNGLTVTTSREAVTYTNTGGYIEPHTSDEIASSKPNDQVNYLKGVKLAAPSSGVAKFDITVPNGSTTDFITFQFQVDTSGNVTVIEPD